MERQIPIIVTTRANKKRHILFRVPSPKLVQQNKSMQEEGKIAISNDVPDQNRTRSVSKRTQSGTCTRARRISSSTASKRFPKDFFRAQPCNRSLLNKPQKQDNSLNMNFLDTFSQRSFLIRAQDQNKSVASCKSQLTPKFKSLKQKKNNQTTQNQKENKRIDQLPQLHNLNQFTSFKPEILELDLSKKCQKKEQKQRQMKQITSQFSNFNITLGQKINMAFIFKKDKERKRIMKLKQKQTPFNLPLILNGVTIARTGGVFHGPKQN